METLELETWKTTKWEPSNEKWKYHIEAVNELTRQFQKKKIEIVRLQPYSNPQEWDEPPVIPRIDDGGIVFEASRYVGRFAFKNVEIKINPHFGENTLNLLLSAAANVYLPPAEASMTSSKENRDFWLLLVVVWKAMLRRAILDFPTPRSFVEERKNIRNYRGRLDIRPHIRLNWADASRFYCRYSKLSADNTINRTILHILRLLKSLSFYHDTVELIEYESRLLSMGVNADDITVSDIDKIKYNRMNEIYKPVMQVSKLIMEKYGSRFTRGEMHEGASFFIDMTELWETYLLRVLRKYLSPKGYRVLSPNAMAPIYLLENEMRSIRPDMLIYDNNRPLLIIDAKYKDYKELGKTARNDYNTCVSREDLYQLVTYLHHYASSEHLCGKRLTGIFSAPVLANSDKLYSFNENRLHSLGLINLNLAGIEDVIEKDGYSEGLKELHKREKTYADRIMKILDPLSDS